MWTYWYVDFLALKGKLPSKVSGFQGHITSFIEQAGKVNALEMGSDGSPEVTRLAAKLFTLLAPEKQEQPMGLTGVKRECSVISIEVRLLPLHYLFLLPPYFSCPLPCISSSFSLCIFSPTLSKDNYTMPISTLEVTEFFTASRLFKASAAQESAEVREC